MLSFIFNIDPYALAALVSVVVMAVIALRQMWSLHEMLATLKDAMDAGGQGIVFFDQKGRFQHANMHAQRYLPFLGHGDNCLLSDILDYLFDHAAEVDSGLRQALAKSSNDPEGANFREVISVDDDALCLVEMRKMESGRTAILMRDVTRMRDREAHVIDLNQELKVKEAEFFKAQKLDALGRLAAGVAHDFNNVLSIIEGYSRMIVKRVDEPELILQHVEKMQTATKRGAGLTKQMLTFSRHTIVDDSVIDVGNAVAEQEALLKPLMEAGIDLSIVVDGDNLCASCSSDSIAQIILNLGINARDAMVDDGGVVTVRLAACEADDLPEILIESSPGQEFLCLSVSDTGTGMEEDVMEHIFDPFYTTKEQGKGTGLGLSVVYGMVQAMSGFIHLESKLSRGTTFYIYIPRSDKEPERQIKGAIDDLESIELKGYTVLVAEDEPDLRDILCATLEGYGMNVLAAPDGNEALVLQDDHMGEIDVLLTDIVMPGLDGLKLGELFQSLRPDSHVIYMSGYPAGGDAARVDLPDDAYFMAKPLDYDALCRLLFVCLSGGDKDGKFDLSKMTAAHWKTQSPKEITEETTS